jgi:hypothetical protein
MNVRGAIRSVAPRMKKGIYFGFLEKIKNKKISIHNF